MFEKKEIPQEKYNSTKPEQELKKLQLVRTLISVATTLLFVLPPLLIGQKGLTVLATSKKLNVLASSLIVFYFVTAIFSLYCLVNGFFRYAFKTEIPAQNLPKNDYKKYAWAVIEWQFYLTTIFAVAEIALTVFAFSLGGLFVALSSIASAVGAYFIKKISLSYCSTLNINTDEAVEPDDIVEQEPTALPKFKNIDEEAEDFYDDLN